MSQKSTEEISVKKVFDLLSSYFDNAYDGLLSVLHEEPNYKRLLKTGEQQFFEAPCETSIEVESQKSRLCFAKTNFLAVQVDNDIDRIIQEKFQGEFLDKLKDEVLKTLLKLSSESACSSDASPPPSTSSLKPKKTDESKISETSKNVQNNYAPKNYGRKKQVNEVANGQAKSSCPEKTDGICPPTTYSLELKKDDSDADISVISFGSVSSVNTSDLSSFDDEISLTSDEESGVQGRRLSLKEVQERLEKSNTTKMDKIEDNNQGENGHAEDTQSETPVNGSESSNISHKEPRRRKPNSKYAADDIVFPLKRKSTEDIASSSQPAKSDIPRKRGRPRKHST